MRILGGLWIAVAALGALGCGPIWMFPGGALSGEVKPVPSDWSFSDAFETVALETRPAAPYSVNIWGVGIGDRFYVGAGSAGNTWAEAIGENPDVRLRIGDSIFELRAMRTADPVETDAFLAALQRKYAFEPKPEQREQATVFRLDPRP